MPRIFDNIDQPLVDALLDALEVTERADFCVGYFNMRGWRRLDSAISKWDGGEGHCCRLLVGMHRPPDEQLQSLFSLDPNADAIDLSTAARRRKEIVQAFSDQLKVGAPSNDDEAGLRRLAAQIRAKKVVVKLFLAYPLHAKLYLLFRPNDRLNPAIGFVGSSNLTFAGLSRQGELNVDVVEHDACEKLARWFEDRWNDHYALDISEELVRIIEESWAREELISPYHIYIKMAYHLSQEARAGVSEFRIPSDFGNELFEFQSKAVQIAAHHLTKRGGVLIGDVVGLGKTLMATALARLFEDLHGIETLVLCPKNLVPMWNDYRVRYRLRATVLPISMARKQLPGLPRHRLVLIDESHNLRNREGKTYRAIRDYIDKNDSQCILLSATPFNKNYLDLSSQLRLFLAEDFDLGIRPEALWRELGEIEFPRRVQSNPRALPAFEKSSHVDDWRDLMRLFLVRRTRSFIKQHYAPIDPETNRKYLLTSEGKKLPFPDRVPRTIKVKIDRKSANDQYAKLFDGPIVDAVTNLHLPRYGLGNYIKPTADAPPTAAEEAQTAKLSRAGRRLMGFCRTNLFKRLESSGQAFLLSVERHILRNFVFLHALENNLPLPLGTQDAELLDPRFNDDDGSLWTEELDDAADPADDAPPTAESALAKRAAEVYELYAGPLKKRFGWLRSSIFIPELAKHLREDIDALLGIIAAAGVWDPKRDVKLKELIKLVATKHADEKVLIFTQFADTVHYLEAQLQAHGITAVQGVTGRSENPTAVAWRFSPESNHKRDRVPPDQEVRVLICTDVLSEGQNLQDAAIVVNFDLPWAIIRLVQRAGRVDRIGQMAETILCYSFLPADGVERIINLRARVRARLTQNAEVVGTDEAFFEGDSAQAIHDLYNEKAGLLDGDADGEIDFGSKAFQIWADAIAADPSLKAIIENLPSVVFSTKSHAPTPVGPEGALVYVRTPDDNDALAWIARDGRTITESMPAILDAAACTPDTPPLPRLPEHHDLVKKALEVASQQESKIGGKLGRPAGARFKTYERLKSYVESLKNSQFVLYESKELLGAIEEIYRFPLTESARYTLNSRFKASIHDEDLAELVLDLRRDGRLCQVSNETKPAQPQIICSLGLANPSS